MILKNKKLLLITSLLTLLPIPVGLLLWDKFPEQMAIHFGLAGQADGFASIPVAVFFPPLALLAGQWICIFFTTRDPGNKNRNHKPLSLVLWIIPVMSNLVCGILYALSLGVSLNPVSPMVIAMGLMFAAIGNYLPKCKMNATMGIKVPWAYTSEENWNATHRFGGRVWVIGGIALMLCGLIPGNFGVWAMFLCILVLVLLPVCYSWRYYKKQLSRGEPIQPIPKLVNNMSRGSLIAVACLLVFLAVFLFSGSLTYQFGEDALTIEASYYQDFSVDYASIQSLEYREGNVDGLRVGGFGSFHLLMGFFQNEEFGNYTRYTYYKPESCIVLTWRERTVVLSGKDAAETQAIYQQLLEKTN